MLNAEEIQRLKGLATEVADREGCVVYDLEFSSGSGGLGRTLRIYIDKPGVGVSLEDCANVSRAMNLSLDADDFIPGGAYQLEVSSPGLDRSLREPWHFQGVVGKKVWLKSHQSMVPAPAVRKQVTGELKGADEQSVTITFEGGEVTIPYSNIDKAKLIFEMEPAGLPPRGNKKKKK